MRDIPNASPAFIAPVDLSNVVNQVHDPVDLTLASNNSHLMFHGAQQMGQAGDDGVTDRGKYQVASVYIYFPGYTTPGALLRYGRPIARLDASTQRVWLSILAAVFGATFLAALASVLISRRTLRPISALTATARHIAVTRDPAVALEEPIADDEVAELTRTFNEMLHELSLSRAEGRGPSKVSANSLPTRPMNSGHP